MSQPAQSQDPFTPPQVAANASLENLPPHRYALINAALQAAICQTWQDFGPSLLDQAALLDAIAQTSHQSRLVRNQAASATGQASQVALALATEVEGDIAQLNNSIHEKLQQFDAQLKIASQTMHQEVDQKVSQLRRHIQQQSNTCRARLARSGDRQESWVSGGRRPLHQCLAQTTLRRS